MWTVLVHLSGPACSVAAVLVVLGVAARPVFRYPHMWRYMESRLWARQGHVARKPRCVSDTEYCQRARRCRTSTPRPHTRRTAASSSRSNPER
jgi:hypothetical protein